MRLNNEIYLILGLIGIETDLFQVKEKDIDMSVIIEPLHHRHRQLLLKDLEHQAPVAVDIVMVSPCL